jgi:hypothetical protein
MKGALKSFAFFPSHQGNAWQGTRANEGWRAGQFLISDWARESGLIAYHYIYAPCNVTLLLSAEGKMCSVWREVVAVRNAAK